MQSSSYELSTPEADGVYVKIYPLKKSFAYAENDDSPVIRYPTDTKSAGFRFQLRASRMSSHTEELWYNETVRQLD